ncbi:MAG TPA: aminopeptidase P family protein [bacterium]|nr:aminopeptidase P family protein [bacterium]
MKIRERIKKLRELMKENDIQAWIVPSADPHQSEYVADRWKSRAWISGFTGSAGTVVIMSDKAGLWTDSRYFIQADRELEGSGIKLFKMKVEGVPEMEEWLNEQLAEGDTIGFDGKCMSVAQTEGLKAKVGEGINFKTDLDLIDQIWSDRPAIPMGKVENYPADLCGETRKEKLERVRNKMAEKDCNGYLVTALDSVAWLYNLRGQDVEYNPVAIAYAFVSDEDAYLFIKDEKLDEDIRKKLSDSGIIIKDYDAIIGFLNSFNDKKVLLDPGKTSIRLKAALPDSCEIDEETDLVTVMKAVKNETELQGFRKVHIKDGVALVKWLKWLDEAAGKQDLNEWKIAEKLAEFRSQQQNYRGPSFHPIVGYRENGAIVHYSPSEDESTEVGGEGVLLTDTGGQYFEGTTDITRTFSLGNPAEKEKEIFTMVLKGHIDLAKARFPKGYSGKMVDTFAGAPLWAMGRDYKHGTGHGLGQYLNVHDGPGYYQIRNTHDTELQPGMVLSNEPGFYLEGEFGVRVENIVVVTEKEKTEYGTFYGFETISYCPIDTSLIDKEAMTADQIEWLNEYHKTVFEKLSPHLSDDEKAWLKEKTKAI